MRNRIQREDEEVQLEPKVMEVLLCLAKRPGKTVTKERFMEEVWRETIVTDDVLSRCISQLRKVFDDDPQDPSYIETIRKTGYRLVASVERPESTTPVSSGPNGAPATALWAKVEAPIQRFLQTVQANVPEAVWRHTFGRFSQRTRGVVLVGVLGILLVSGLVFWTSMGGARGGDAPISALSFTSFPGEEFDPSLSAPGHKVAFAWRKPDSPHQNIYLMQRGAEQPLQLSADSTTDWSPTWSPDGRFVAYVQDDEGRDQISIIPSIGGQASQTLTLRHRDIQSIAWMPDTSDRTLVVSAQRRPHRAFALSLHHPDTDSLAPLTKPPSWSTGDVDPAPSPDGSRIAFVRGTVQGVENIFVVPTSGAPPTQITTDSTTIDGLAWSADGSDILYAAERGGVWGLWRVSADGGSPSLIRSASTGTRFSHPTLSPQSNRLVYTQGSAQLDLWKLNRSTQYENYTATPLLSSTREDTHPSISPNGKRIAFVSDRSGTSEIWVAQADGSSPNRLTDLGGPTIHAVQWSPTGKRLCFVARRNGQSDLHVLPASGGTPSRLTKAPSEDLVPRWSRDGRWVYFSSNRTGIWEVWRVRAAADTHRVQQVTTGGAVAAQESRTDSTLYFVRPDTAGIWRLPLDTSRLPLTTDPSAFPINVIGQFDPKDRRSWWVGRDGLHFLHRQSKGALLAHFDLETRRILPLYEFPDWRPVQSLAVGPGGEWFAYTHVVQRESDVMLVENFR